MLLQLFAALMLQADMAHAAEAPIANGLFLVAKPALLDPNFRETVVLVTQPIPGGGTLGVILNRPLAARLSELFPEAAGALPHFDPLYAGGPVARNQLLFLVRSQEPPSTALRVLDDVVLSGDRELLSKIVSGRMKVNAFRAYAGFAGWAARQLQVEIAQGGWYVIPADADTIFSADAATLWAELIKRINARSARRNAELCYA